MMGGARVAAVSPRFGDRARHDGRVGSCIDAFNGERTIREYRTTAKRAIREVCASAH